MQALVSGDRDRFRRGRAGDRAAAGMPPYGRLASLIVSGPDPGGRGQCCAGHRAPRPQKQGVTVLGPSTAPLALLRGRHRGGSAEAGREIRRAAIAARLAGRLDCRFSALAGRRRSLFLPVTRTR
jgi:hypothetical protein